MASWGSGRGARHDVRRVRRRARSRVDPEGVGGRRIAVHGGGAAGLADVACGAARRQHVEAGGERAIRPLGGGALGVLRAVDERGVLTDRSVPARRVGGNRPRPRRGRGRGAGPGTSWRASGERPRFHRSRADCAAWLSSQSRSVRRSRTIAPAPAPLKSRCRPADRPRSAGSSPGSRRCPDRPRAARRSRSNR